MIGISEKTMAIHRDKLYAGYVKKLREIWDRLAPLRERIIAGESIGNATFSDLRAVKVEETFAANGVYLHEWYFGNISGDGDWSKAPELASAIAKKWGSIENGIKDISECAMAARGWALLVWDHKQQKIMQYNADSHNQGGVWGCIPIIVLDVYEHAYFIDFGADRKAYIEAFWKNFDWKSAEDLYNKVKDITL